MVFCLSNLTLVADWKEVVARLILMSYKLSAVVSPVVQSSSPEGLIPMDSDSGKQNPKRILLKSETPEVLFVLKQFRMRGSFPPFHLLILGHNLKPFF